MKKIFFAILTLSIILRSYQVLSLPALNADEAALGYNAYSLLQTGKDEHGNSWPIHFQSFNDYKPGLYVYLLLPFVKILGLNILAVRLPGIIFGVGTVVLIYFFVKYLFPSKKSLALLAMFFLAISPWHIHFSRGGWEVNIATFFILLGVLAFLKGLKSHRWLIISVISFTLSLYTYHASRIIVPLLLIGLGGINFKECARNYKFIIVSIVFGGVLLFPLTLDLVGPAGLSRASGVGLLADTGPYWRTNEQRGEHEGSNSLFVSLLHNKYANYGIKFFSNYLSHYSGEFLFISGDQIQRNKVPEIGQMYLASIIFFTLGLFATFKNIKKWNIVLVWLVVAPLAAALTFQSPHALRSQNMVIPTTIITAFGILTAFEFVKNKYTKVFPMFFVLCSLLYLWDFTRYLDQYYIHMAKTYDFSSQNGFSEVADYLLENESKYDKIIITDRYDQPYILTLFYLKYDPELFQKSHNLTTRDGFGFSTVRNFGKYTFISPAPWDKIRSENPGALIIGTNDEIPDATNIQKVIKFPSGRIAFKIVAN